MLSYLLANWKPMLASAAVAGAAAWFLKPDPRPAVKLQEQEHVQATTQAATDQTVQAGPVRVTELEFGPMERPRPGGGQVLPGLPAPNLSASPATPDGLPAHGPLLKATVTEQGPTTTETHSDTRATASDDRKLDLTVTPQARAGWALQIGLEDVLGDRYLRAAARRRLLGPVWVEVSAVPVRRTLGAALAVEW